MERIQREETPRLGVSEGIRTFRKESAGILSSDNPKGLWKGYQDKKPLSRGFSDTMNMDHLNSEIRKLKGQDFNSVLYKIFYRLQRFQNKRKEKFKPGKQPLVRSFFKRVLSGIRCVGTPTRNIRHEFFTKVVHFLDCFVRKSY
jgi:hypothetical protein